MDKLKEINGKFYRECEILMLPTYKADNALLLLELRGCKNLEYHSNQFFTQEYLEATQRRAHHLYIVSNEEIEITDWYTNGNDIFNCTDLKSVDKTRYTYLRKIIASTNNELGYGDNVGAFYHLPHPSVEFIQAYIKSFDEGKLITKVLVEYFIDYEPGNQPRDRKYDTCCPKVNSSNEITIKKLKDSYTREEVIRLINKSHYDRCGNPNMITAELKVEDKWFDENL